MGGTAAACTENLSMWSKFKLVQLLPSPHHQWDQGSIPQQHQHTCIKWCRAAGSIHILPQAQGAASNPLLLPGRQCISTHLTSGPPHPEEDGGGAEHAHVQGGRHKAGETRRGRCTRLKQQPAAVGSCCTAARPARGRAAVVALQVGRVQLLQQWGKGGAEGAPAPQW
jgi:hypothetical protein